MPVNHSKNIIEVKNISFSYGKELILKDINLDIHEGDYLGIVGPNGGGKTTLIKLILKLLKPKSGNIIVNVPVIGYVSQNTTNFDINFPITIREVVSQGRLAGQGIFYKLTNEDWRMIDQALQTVGLFNIKDRLIGELSGGQQQRVFIARAIAGHHPHIIILDEPTAGIDITSQNKFYSFLKKLNRDLKITLVLVTHEVDKIAKEANHVAFINQSLVFYENPKVLLKKHYLFDNHKHV